MSKTEITPASASLLDVALRVAVESQFPLRRKDGRMTYLVHPFDVLSRVYSWGVEDETTWGAALCHDVDEETHGENRDWMAILQAKGAALGLKAECRRLAIIVTDELTYIPDDGRYASKDRYMESFATASPVALCVKFADRICNTLNFYNTAKQKGYSKPTKARAYFSAAQCLFGAWVNRRNDLVEYYNDHVWRSGLNDWESLKETLAA